MNKNKMSIRTVYVFLEIPTFDLNTTVFTTVDSNPAADILKKFQFRSSKTLIEFLTKNQDAILTSIPYSEEEILTALEVQNFLGYLNVKWYKADEQEESFQKNNIQVITPEEILDLAIKYKGITSKDVMNYILETRDDISYEIHKSTITLLE